MLCTCFVCKMCLNMIICTVLEWKHGPYVCTVFSFFFLFVKEVLYFLVIYHPDVS